MTKSIQLWLSKEEIEAVLFQVHSSQFVAKPEENYKLSIIAGKLDKALKKAGKDE